MCNCELKFFKRKEKKKKEKLLTKQYLKNMIQIHFSPSNFLFTYNNCTLGGRKAKQNIEHQNTNPLEE